jgi:hypothetical protein
MGFGAVREGENRDELKMNKSLIIDKNSKLLAGDTIKQTHGCRHNNANHCKNIDLDNICTFVREENICKKPQNGWKKQYEYLSSLA